MKKNIGSQLALYPVPVTVIGAMNEVNIVATINMSTNSSILVEQGIGYAIVIEGSLPYIDKNIICMRPLCPEKTATSVIAWKKSQTFAPAARRFLEYIQDKLTE